MITPVKTWLCRCSKCHHQWNTRSSNIPERCANVECKKANWNDDYSFEPEPIAESAPVPVTPEPSAYHDRLATARAALASVGTPTVAAPVETEWTFTKEPVQFADDGNCYRHQANPLNPRQRRVVQVDCENWDAIIKPVK